MACRRSSARIGRVDLPPQQNFLTLACRDTERMADFLRALAWPESPESEPVHV